MIQKFLMRMITHDKTGESCADLDGVKKVSLSCEQKCNNLNGVPCCVNSGADIQVCVMCVSCEKPSSTVVVHRASHVPGTYDLVPARSVTLCLHPHRKRETNQHEQTFIDCCAQVPTGD